ncbi:MAG: DUF2237 domain-containing protein [Wenzhouxiangellaceae bacterium]|nr:DUF2237 domain-containing protein [Wenzhouxiangellaceae bacterium]
MAHDRPEQDPSINVLDEVLQKCSAQPVTGFFRDGCCNTCEQDIGCHTVCAVMTADFLDFSRQRGNDLAAPNPAFGFPGLKPGDAWCLCAGRWLEAYQAGCAPRVALESTHRKTLEIVPLEALKQHAVGMAH